MAILRHEPGPSGFPTGGKPNHHYVTDEKGNFVWVPDHDKQLSEKIEALKGGDDIEIITKSGVVVNVDAERGAEIAVSGGVSDVVTIVHHGKNFVPFIATSGAKNGVAYTVNDDGSVTIEGTATATAYIDFATTANPVFLPSGTYMLSGDVPMGLDVKIVLQNKETGENIATIGYDADQRAFTLSEGTYVKGYMHVTKGVVVSNTVHMQIERGASTTEYEKCVRTQTETTLPTTVAALAGRNVLYTTTGDTITAKMTVAKSDDDSAEYKFDSFVWGLPVLTLDGDCNGMTKDDYVPLAVSFPDKDGNDISGTVEVAKQGSSSIGIGTEIGGNFDDELGGLFNLKIKFPVAFEAVEGWGAHSKYYVKVYAIDHSHLRDVGSQKHWADITRSRSDAPDWLKALPNCGAIDGFPVIIVINGKYYALGSFNIPKDGWMAGEPEAILSAKTHCDATRFKALATLDGDFELEYIKDETNQDWVLPSINAAIQAVMNSNGTDLATVGQYVDFGTAMDHMIHVVDEDANDCTDKNYLAISWDKVKWYVIPYDKDTIYGLHWTGKSFSSPAAGVSYKSYAEHHALMGLIYNHKKAELKARAIELREGVTSEAHVTTLYTNLAASIPSEVLAQNAKRWPLLRSTNATNLAQLLNWYRLRRAHVDKEIDSWTV